MIKKIEIKILLMGSSARFSLRFILHSFEHKECNTKRKKYPGNPKSNLYV